MAAVRFATVRDAVRLRSLGGPGQAVPEHDIRSFVLESLRSASLDGQSVCVLVPDATRSAPLPLVLSAIHEALHGRVSRLTVLVALGTHPGMTDAELAALAGYEAGQLPVRYPGMTVLNHEWWDPASLVTIGEIPAATVAEISGGRLSSAVTVRINRQVVEHDVALVVGPVFPHEVVGFSGGNKYFFPGVSGPEMIDLSHWLGALITSREIIGTPGVTAVRALINAACELIPTRRLCLAMVVRSGSRELHSLAFGTPEAAWEAAAEVSAVVHVRRLNAPVRRVLSLVSTRYDEMWTAAKGMYKVEPVVADGGEVVLYAPHVREVSRTHGELIRAIGYHCRDYFTGQPDRFAGIPGGVLAHSTHLRGAGTYDAETGERCRITVTLATGIDESTTRSLNLSYRDPAGIQIEQWRLDADTLVVPDAGEVLYRLSAHASEAGKSS